MNKILKDNLMDVITVGGVKCYSISEALKEDLRRFKEKLPYGMASYMGKLMVLDIESECESDSGFENNDFKDCESLYSNTYKQVSDINELFKTKEGE